jgi:ABC-2 type transport system ATP-binding protein
MPGKLMHTAADPVVNFSKIFKTYAKELGAQAYPALVDLSFSMNAGETLGLIGANGAGKSTAIKLIMDFIRPDQGEIKVLGVSPQNQRARRRIGYLPEVANFPANLTALDMLRFAGSTCGMKNTEIKVVGEKWLRRLGLWEAGKRPLRNYSKGMQQRANFALALLNDPELLILDEPMSGLDPIGRADILSLIGELKAQGRAILFCSHILEDVDRLVDKVLVLHKGKTLFSGPPHTLAEQQSCPNMVEGYLCLVKKETGND